MAAFTATLKIYPVTMQLAHPKTDMECGGKVVLPVSALHALTSRVSFLQKSPMLFMISFGLKNTHCGVLEFTAEEGNVNVPSWILGTLQANIGDTVQELRWKFGDGKKVAFAFGFYSANFCSKPVHVGRNVVSSPIPGQ
uniref:Ubiquitin fusion degradation protein 1 n=1 Tax=Lygus hesperus TaxID=30085 RepID=A0A0A9XX91_LYGHE